MKKVLLVMMKISSWKMKKSVIAAVLLLGFFSALNAQIEAKIQQERVVPGAIFLHNGQEIAGYVKVGSLFNSEVIPPCLCDFQNIIYFIPKDVFENTPKIDNRLYKSYKTKDISGYRFLDMEFESVKYADLSAVGPDMLSRWRFLRRIINGKISVFYFYPLHSRSIEDGILLCRKGQDGKIIRVKGGNGFKGIDMEKDWEDCPYVKEKQANGEYQGTELEIRLMAIEDYNTYCN